MLYLYAIIILSLCLVSNSLVNAQNALPLAKSQGQMPYHCTNSTIDLLIPASQASLKLIIINQLLKEAFLPKHKLAITINSFKDKPNQINIPDYGLVLIAKDNNFAVINYLDSKDPMLAKIELYANQDDFSITTDNNISSNQKTIWINLNLLINNFANIQSQVIQ